jgi:hypothetical protein
MTGMLFGILKFKQSLIAAQQSSDENAKILNVMKPIMTD